MCEMIDSESVIACGKVTSLSSDFLISERFSKSECTQDEVKNHETR